jgi:hypothetical protein
VVPTAAPTTCGDYLGNAALFTFADWRAGNSFSVGNMPLGSGSLKGSSGLRIVFHFKYIIGYCSTRGVGDAPTVRVRLNGNVVWTSKLDLADGDDYPDSAGCGGSPTSYSPPQTASFTVQPNAVPPAYTPGSLQLDVTMGNRNMHIVGLGGCVMQIGPASTA